LLAANARSVTTAKATATVTVKPEADG
jgi:hypothetical protein